MGGLAFDAVDKSSLRKTPTSPGSEKSVSVVKKVRC